MLFLCWKKREKSRNSGKAEGKCRVFLPPANEVCEGYVFTRVCLSTVGGGIPACLAGLQGGVSQHALQVSRPTPKGELEGSGRRGGSPGPHLGGVSMPTHGGVSRPTPRGGVSRPTPGWGVSQRAVRILLECILVYLYQSMATLKNSSRE